MILFPHMLVGAAIGSKVNSYGAILVIATVLHFLFDRFPHSEYLKKLNFNRLSSRDLFTLFLVALIDLLTGVFLIWMFLKDSIYSYCVLLGILISILPDGFVFLHVCTRLLFRFEVQVLKRFNALHDSFHVSKQENSPFFGFVVEGLIVSLSIFLIFKGA